MARVNLTDVLSTIDTTATADSTASAPELAPTTPEIPRRSKPRSNGLHPAPAPVPDRSAAEQPRGPRYLQLDRKDLRIRGDQADELSALTRRLNRARGSAGERITDNTLIRVAIDLLLQQRDRLAGRSEAELTASVISGVTESGSPEDNP
jgi:hypothetical protein